MVTDAHISVDDSRAKRNALLLAAGQALYGSNIAVLVTLSGLAGQYLAPDPALATLPWSALVIGTAASTVPASMFMRRTSRRRGFLLGTLASMLGTSLAIAALFGHSFWLFCVGMMFCGTYQAFAGYYRFAAVDTASDAFRPRAISWVMAGGVVAAFVGGQLVSASEGWLGPVPFVGGYATCLVLGFIAFIVLSFIDIPPLGHEELKNTGRPLSEILRQRTVFVAIACAMIGYGIMTLVMTATPIAMIGCNYAVSDAAFVIQWHIFAMFAPSFFTGNLIVRFGVMKVIGTGLALLAACGVVALGGVELERFLVALMLLGLGWNFTFVGATTLLTSGYATSERNKVQAANDLLVFATVAIASFASGGLLNGFGWEAVNYALFPFVAAAAGLAVWFALKDRIAA
ncbi:MAG: MFS transporter [Parvibaculaceae bacterium]